MGCKKRQIQAVYHQYNSIPRIAVIKTVHNFIASFLLEHHKGKSYFLHSGCPIKKKKKGASEKTRTWQEVLYSHLRVRDKKAPPTFVLSDPFFSAFLGLAVNSDESIRIIINCMTLLLFI